MREGISGIYFKNKHGEMIASRALQLVVSETDEWFDRAEREEAVEYLGPDMMTFATFKRRWVMKRPFRDLFQRFKTWNTSPNSAPRTPPQDGISPIRLSLAEVVDTMNAFGTILAFECDRPYESWYAAKVPFPLKEVKAFCAKPVFSDPGLKEFRESLRDYLDALDIDVTWRET